MDKFVVKFKVEKGIELEIYLNLEYKNNKRSYRWISNDIGINGRTVKKLLVHFGIEIRYGSDAVKTQWIDNAERKKKQGEIFRISNSGVRSNHRVEDDVIALRLEKKGLILLERVFVDGYSYFETKCNTCCKVEVKTSKNMNLGCKKCYHDKWTFADQATVREERIKTRTWRIDVFKRDNYTCQCCGNPENLRAHHMNNFVQYSEERMLLENGITLCKVCHDSGQKGSFHDVYGCYFNTKEQTLEYIKVKKEQYT